MQAGFHGQVFTGYFTQFVMYSVHFTFRLLRITTPTIPFDPFLLFNVFYKYTKFIYNDMINIFLSMPKWSPPQQILMQSCTVICKNEALLSCHSWTFPFLLPLQTTVKDFHVPFLSPFLTHSSLKDEVKINKTCKLWISYILNLGKIAFWGLVG